MKYTINDAMEELRKLCYPDEYREKSRIQEYKSFLEEYDNCIDEAVYNSNITDLSEDMIGILFTIISYIGREDFIGQNPEGTPIFAHDEMDDIIVDEYTDTSWGEGYTETEDGTSLY